MSQVTSPILKDSTGQAILTALENIGANYSAGSSISAAMANSMPPRFKNISDDWFNGTLRTEVAAGNFKNVRPGDYIIGPTSGTKYIVAECDGWYQKGDSTNAQTNPAGVTHHLRVIVFKHEGSTRLWAGKGDEQGSWTPSAADKGRCPWNAETTADPTSASATGKNSTNITRAYNGTNYSGYLGSFIRERIDAVILEEDFKADFGSANVLKYRNWVGSSINAEAKASGMPPWSGITAGCTWVDRYCDLPSEVELYGAPVFSSSAYDTGCQDQQLALFKNCKIEDIFPRIDIWTKCVASSSHAAIRNNNVFATTSGASYANWASPLACIK